MATYRMVLFPDRKIRPGPELLEKDTGQPAQRTRPTECRAYRMGVTEYQRCTLLLPASGTNGKRQLPQVPGTVQPRRSRPADRRYRRNRSSSDAGSAKI